MDFESSLSVLLIKQMYHEYQHFSLENSKAAGPEETGGRELILGGKKSEVGHFQ